MKKAIVTIALIITTTSFAQRKNFVRAENSKHKVVMTEFLKTMTFDGKTYTINERRGVFQYRKDSIVWVIGQDPNNWGHNPIRIGFYNDFKNYVVSSKTEKL
jgi:hypothetical protein